MPNLADIVAAEAALVSGFIRLLEEEQALLKHGDAEALPDVVERKTAKARELAAASGERNRLLNAAGLAADRAGIEGWLTHHPDDAAVRKEWEHLQFLAAEARELNRVNGELIQLRLQNNAQSLEVLLAAANRQDLYGADGQAAQATTRRIIDSA